MNSENFGKMISKLRKKAGLTQVELASRLNVTDKAISKWENGGGFPEITQIPALSEVFGVSSDYILKGNPHGIAIAGNIIVDSINIIEKYPEKTMLTNVLGQSNAVGGCVCNTIIDIAKIDPDVFLTAIGKVGADDNGHFVTSQMQKYGIDTSKVVVSDTCPTSNTIVMSEQNSGERTFFCVPGASGEFGIDDIDIDALDCKIFHAGYIMLLAMLDAEDEEYGTKMARLLANVQNRGIKTSVDVVSAHSNKFAEKIIPALKYCDYAIMNEIESCSVTGIAPRHKDGSIHIENIKSTMETLMGYGIREKLIIHSSEAGFMLDSQGNFTVVGSLCLPSGYIKGSTGAGDAYAAGCLYGIYQGYEGEKLLEFASGSAAMSLSKPDSISGMKPKKEIENIIEKYPRREIL